MISDRHQDHFRVQYNIFRVWVLLWWGKMITTVWGPGIDPKKKSGNSRCPPPHRPATATSHFLICQSACTHKYSMWLRRSGRWSSHFAIPSPSWTWADSRCPLGRSTMNDGSSYTWWTTACQSLLENLFGQSECGRLASCSVSSYFLMIGIRVGHGLSTIEAIFEYDIPYLWNFTITRLKSVLVAFCVSILQDLQNDTSKI